MRLYALSQRQGETCDAAGKAMRDVFSVIEEKGFRTIWSVPKTCPKYLKILDLPYLAAFLLVRAGKGDFVFFSIPENGVKVKLLKAVRKFKKYQVICFINDLNAFRYGNADSPAVREAMRAEAELIGTADIVLTPNVRTEGLLRENGVTSRLIPVGIWDYRMSGAQERELDETKAKGSGSERDTVNIAFAGNLNKSGFLQYLNFGEETRIRFHLWGKLEQERIRTLPPCCTYHGVLKADEVPKAVCTMDYGLVWDGNGTDGIEGGLGEYLRYNNSHKCGLYLASGIPAIVWTQSGMADFVEKHGCGVCIDRLSGLPQALSGADHEGLKKNAASVSKRLRQGYYLKQALETALGEVSE